MKTLLLLVAFLPLCCFSQHFITTIDGNQVKCKITQISDSAILYQLPNKGTSTFKLTLDKVVKYRLDNGITYQVSQAQVPLRDTIVSIVKTEENTELIQQYIDNQNKAIGKALKKAGTVSLAVGVPCLAAGVAGLLYANLLPNPVAGYTTSKQKALLEGTTYITVDEYNAKLRDFNNQTSIAEMAGYIMTPLGGALTIVGIPLYVSGNKMLKLNVQVSGNGAGVAVNF